MNTSIAIVLRLSVVVLICMLLSGCNFGLGSSGGHQVSRDNIIIEEISRKEDKQTDGQTGVVKVHTETINGKVSHNELGIDMTYTIYNDFLLEETRVSVGSRWASTSNLKHIRALAAMYDIAADEVEEAARFPIKP